MILCYFFLLQKLLYITIILHETLTFLINKIKTKIFGGKIEILCLMEYIENQLLYRKTMMLFQLNLSI